MLDHMNAAAKQNDDTGKQPEPFVGKNTRFTPLVLSI